MSRVYRKYLKLLEKWPIDPTKKGRDLGEYLREEVKKSFGSGINFTGDEEKCEAYYLCLKRIADDHYSNKYPRTRTNSASGFNTEELYHVLSDDFLEYVEEEKPALQKPFNFFSFRK